MLLPVVMTLIANQKKDTLFMKILVKLCYPNWALEAFIIANAERSVSISEFIFPFLIWSLTNEDSLVSTTFYSHHVTLVVFYFS